MMHVFISSLPTTDTEDIKIAKGILNGTENTNGSTDKLIRELKNIFKEREVLLFNRGREAMYFALKELGVTQGDEVILQAFTCVAVPTPILWLKAKPVYVDINADDFNINMESLKQKITPKTKVIIVQHTFGNMANIKQIKEVIGDRNIYIIEDCAHLFSTNLKDSDVNKYSDISFFSFAQDKAISSVQGGLLVINNPAIKSEMLNAYMHVAEQSSIQARYNARYIKLWGLIKKYYFTSLLPFYKKATIGKVLIIIFRKLGLIRQQASNTVEQIPVMNKISDIQSHLLLNQLSKCNEMNIQRRRIAQIYATQLREEFKGQDIESTLIRYPVILDNPEEVLHILSNNGYICGRWYNSAVFPLHTNLEEVGYQQGECPMAELLAQKIINLPTNIEVTANVAEEIAAIVNKYGNPFKFID